jgi:hypothetical protein
MLPSERRAEGSRKPESQVRTAVILPGPGGPSAAQDHLERSSVACAGEHVIGLGEVVQGEMVRDEPSGIDLVGSKQPEQGRRSRRRSGGSSAWPALGQVSPCHRGGERPQLTPAAALATPGALRRIGVKRGLDILRRRLRNLGDGAGGCGLRLASVLAAGECCPLAELHRSDSFVRGELGFESGSPVASAAISPGSQPGGDVGGGAEQGQSWWCGGFTQPAGGAGRGR